MDIYLCNFMLYLVDFLLGCSRLLILAHDNVYKIVRKQTEQFCIYGQLK